MIFTLPPSFLTEMFIHFNHLNFTPRIRREIPGEVMERLNKVPYFKAGYEPDGLTPQEFDRLPALLSTWEEFKGAMDKIVVFTAEAMHQDHLQPLPA